jgi:hypothetical protein
MRSSTYLCLFVSALCLSTSADGVEDPGPGRAEVEAMMGLSSEGDLVRGQLEGTLDPNKLHGLLDTLVDPDDLSYRLPWCGRFSVPFGLELLRKIAAYSGEGIPEGTMLRYGTSLSEPELPVLAETRENGLGYTAPSNLHHWVGYAAIGYRLK